MFGKPDLTTAIVLIALFVALLLGLLSYHRPGRSHVTWGIGLLTLATAAALLSRAVAQPSVGTALILLLVFLAVMMLLLTYQSRRWAHAVWWIGVLLFLLALPLLGAGRGDLTLFSLIAGPGLLMLVATLHPEIPAYYARIGAPNLPADITPEELTTERRRYTQLAAGITLLSLVGVWLVGGVPGAGTAAAGQTGVVVQGLDSLKFDPATINVKAGELVTVTFKNVGAIPHDFITEGLDKNASIVALGGGKEQTATFQANQPGTYQFVCNEPGHREAGMVGKIVVS